MAFKGHFQPKLFYRLLTILLLNPAWFNALFPFMFIIHFWIFTSSWCFKIKTNSTLISTQTRQRMLLLLKCMSCHRWPRSGVSSHSASTHSSLLSRQQELLLGVCHCLSTHLPCFWVKRWWDCFDKLPQPVSCHSPYVFSLGHSVLQPHLRKI